MALSEGRICMFCRSPSMDPILGDFVESGDIIVHTNCLYTASGLVQKCDPEKLSAHDKKRFINGFDNEEVKSELKRGRRLRCRQCGVPGACVGCSNAKCRGTFHLPCLYKANGFAVFRGNFPAYCSIHRPLQDLKSRLSEYQQPPECCICLFALLDIDEFCQNRQKDHLPSTGPCKRSDPSSQRSTSCSTASSKSTTPESSRKHITIIDGGKPLTPVRSRRSSVRKFTSIWEVNNSSVEDSLRSLVKMSQPESRTPPEVKSDNKNWLSLLFSDSEDEGLEPAAPSTAPKTRQPSKYALWSHGILHGQCCRPAWMHRDCITGYAKSAGLHHVKCPLCFNRDTFIEILFTFGVWIPDRDAAWELEPGAFANSDNTEAGDSAASSPSTIPAAASPPDENTKPSAPSSHSSRNPTVQKGIRNRRRLTETRVLSTRHTITRRRTALTRRTPLSEVQPTIEIDRPPPPVDQVLCLDTESEDEATPVAASVAVSSSEAALSGSPNILSVLKYPVSLSPTPSAKPQRRKRNTNVLTAREGGSQSDAAWKLEPASSVSNSPENPVVLDSASSSPSTIPAAVSPSDENTKPTPSSSPSSPNSTVWNGIYRRRRLTEKAVFSSRPTTRRRRTALTRRTSLAEVQPTFGGDRPPARLSTVKEVCCLDRESEGEATPVAAAAAASSSSAEATLSGSPSILSVLKYPSPLSPTPPTKRQRRKRNTSILSARGGRASHRQVYQRKSPDDRLKQTSISAFFTTSDKTRMMDVTNELFKSLLTSDARQTGRYSLRSSDTAASSKASSLCSCLKQPSSQQTL